MARQRAKQSKKTKSSAKESVRRSWRTKTTTYLDSYNFPGFVVGLIFLYLSFLPSLLPRGWVLQGLLSAILFCLGYGVGVLASLVVREFKPNEPKPPRKAKIKKNTLIVGILFYLLFLSLGIYWQNGVRHLVGQSSDSAFSVVGTTLVFVLTVMFLMLIARSIISLFYWLRRIILKVVPLRLARLLALALTVVLVVGFVNGVLFDGLISAANETFGLRDGTTDSGITKPKAPELSGSPASLISWESLGRQGRNFTSKGQRVDKISTFSGAPAKQPVRVYAGLKSADDATGRAELAVKDLKRAGGFDRKVIVVATTTGTGWVDEQGVEGLEYMYNGDTAIVSMQYSYLPSWLSFLVDQSKAKAAGVELYNAVLGEWLKLPPESRPKLVVFGESLGSFGGEAAFTGWSSFRATASGAVWSGPPNFNALWRSTTQNRDSGSPEILPIVDKGRTVRFAVKASDFSVVSLQNWQAPKAVYLQNPTDPIVWWSAGLLFHEPDWLKEPRGADVSPSMHWFPVITFWQVAGDMVFATGVPDNHGHKYGTMPTEAWAQVVPPEGWTAAQTAKLRDFLTP